MITSHGAKCDVCGHFILPLDPDERVHEFAVKGVGIDDRTLHSDNACKAALLEAGSDWTKLPDGPLRVAFSDAAARRGGKEAGR